MLAVTVQIEDQGPSFEQAMETLRRGSEGVGATVGIHEEEGAAPHGEDLLTLVEVAAINEFGSGDGRIPERSFLRAYLDEHEAEILDLVATLWTQVHLGQISPAQARDQLGLSIVGGIQKRIAEGIEPANAESTVRAKGSSTPLINEGQLRAGITHRPEAER